MTHNYKERVSYYMSVIQNENWGWGGGCKTLINMNTSSLELSFTKTQLKQPRLEYEDVQRKTDIVTVFRYWHVGMALSNSDNI